MAQDTSDATLPASAPEHSMAKDASDANDLSAVLPA